MVRYNRDINKPRKLTDVELEKSYRDRGVKITRTLAEKKSFLDNNLTLDQVKELNAKYKVGSVKVGLSKEEKSTKIAEFTKLRNFVFNCNCRKFKSCNFPSCTIP